MFSGLKDLDVSLHSWQCTTVGAELVYSQGIAARPSLTDHVALLRVTRAKARWVDLLKSRYLGLARFREVLNPSNCMA